MIDLEKIEKGRYVLFFTSQMCGDCICTKKKIQPLVDQYQDLFVSVDRSENLELYKYYKVNGIPSFIMIEDGIESSRLETRKCVDYQELKFWLEKI